MSRKVPATVVACAAVVAVVAVQDFVAERRAGAVFDVIREDECQIFYNKG